MLLLHSSNLSYIRQSKDNEFIGAVETTENYEPTRNEDSDSDLEQRIYGLDTQGDPLYADARARSPRAAVREDEDMPLENEANPNDDDAEEDADSEDEEDDNGIPNFVQAPLTGGLPRPRGPLPNVPAALT